MNLDDDLRRALRRQPAPDGVVDKVMARIVEEAPDDRPSPIRFLAVAAAITLVVAGGARYYQHQQAVSEAERVKTEIRLALQITIEKIALVQVRLNDTQVPLQPDTAFEERNP